MQTHYFELRAIAQIELTEVMVVNHLMQSLHSVLAQYDGNIGLSFPAYTQKQHKTLGGIIWLFADEPTLLALKQQLAHLSSIKDYAMIGDVRPIPTNINGYLRVNRAKAKGQSALRRAQRRLTEQGKWSAEVQKNMIEKWGCVDLNYPHCHLISSSTGQRFLLWVQQQQCKVPQAGKFNSYGMSEMATVPHF